MDKAQKGEREKELLLFQTNRCIVNFYKNHLFMLESLKKEHQSMLKKVQENTSQEFSKNIDYFDENKYNYLKAYCCWQCSTKRLFILSRINYSF